MGGNIRLGALVVAALLLAAACGDDDDAATTAVDVTDESSAASVVTGPPPDVTIATAPTGSPCTSPDEAAQAFHEAWASGLQADAGRCATQAAIDMLFGGPAGPSPTETYQGCQGAEAPTTCAYSYEGGAIIFHIGVSDVSFVVESVEFVAD